MDRKKCTEKSNFLATVASEKRIFTRQNISRRDTTHMYLSPPQKSAPPSMPAFREGTKLIETINLDYKANGGLSLPDGTRSGIWIVDVSSELLLASNRLLRRGSFFL